MLQLSDDARKLLLLITMNDAREEIDASCPEACELVARGCIQVERLRLDPRPADCATECVSITDRGRSAIAAHYGMPETR